MPAFSPSMREDDGFRLKGQRARSTEAAEGEGK
jgi:hypothetical protein